MIAALLRHVCRRDTPLRDDRIYPSVKHPCTLEIPSFAPPDIGGAESRSFVESHA